MAIPQPLPHPPTIGIDVTVPVVVSIELAMSQPMCQMRSPTRYRSPPSSGTGIDRLVSSLVAGSIALIARASPSMIQTASSLAAMPSVPADTWTLDTTSFVAGSMRLSVPSSIVPMNPLVQIEPNASTISQASLAGTNASSSNAWSSVVPGVAGAGVPAAAAPPHAVTSRLRPARPVIVPTRGFRPLRPIWLRTRVPSWSRCVLHRLSRS